jgi:GT2 family glycosyltransferase
VLQFTNTVPVAVVIPTYNRGTAVISVLEKIQKCDPQPAEIWVHIDLGDGILERELKERFPSVGVLSSPTRLGPGGGRHRCLLACNTPYAVSFDDDSYPVDSDFFCQVERLFCGHPRAAIFGARIWQRHEPIKIRTETMVRILGFVGCGHAVRLTAYRGVRGYLARPVSFRMEESDLSLQLFAAGWEMYESGHLRVFHDTDLVHRGSAQITSGTITNVGVCAFLNYPIIAWGWGFAQVANLVVCAIRTGHIRGICSGILRIPAECYRNRRYRNPISWQTLKRFIHLNRTVSSHEPVLSG